MEKELTDMEIQFAAQRAMVMDEHYLQEHDVIQRYIRHQLTGEELESFEIQLIANPALINQIENQRLINAAFKQQLPAYKYPPGVFLQYFPPLWRRALPVAATLVLAAFIGFKYFDKPQPVVRTDAAPITAQTLVLESMRGAVAEATIDLTGLAAGQTAGTKVLLPLRIDVGPQLTAGQRYQLQLTAAGSSARLAGADALAASADGWLEYSLELPANLRGHYLLQVSETGSNQQQGYLLNIR